MGKKEGVWVEISHSVFCMWWNCILNILLEREQKGMSWSILVLNESMSKLSIGSDVF